MRNQRVWIWVSFGAVTVLMLVVVFFYSRFMEKQYRDNTNDAVGEIIRTVRQEYPKVGFDQIAMILNGDVPGEGNTDSSGKENVEWDAYGIDVLHEHLIFANHEMANRQFLVLSVIVLCFAAVLCCILFAEMRMTKQGIVWITEYLQAINRHQYRLDIDTNTEGELSLLKNEIYKTAVTLNEQTKLLEKEKVGLKQSLEDISHQLKTPLTSIGVMVDDMLDDPQMDEQVRRDFLRKIHKKISHVNFLVLALLKLSRLDAGVVVFQREKHSVRELVLAACENVEALCDLRDISIRINGNLSDCFECDGKWQTEAMTNVLKNCVEHSEDGSEVEISCRSNDIFIEVMIRDFGEGMSDEEKRHIFERFYKGSGSSEDSIGIGMALAQMIVEKDNGRILVKSEKGKGSTFLLRYL